MLNYAILVGRLVRDPEHRLTSTGIPITRFTIAVKFSRNNDDGNSADFIRVVAWRRLAEVCNQYLKKGRLVAIEGRLQIDSYEKDGESVFLLKSLPITCKCLAAKAILKFKTMTCHSKTLVPVSVN